MSMLKIIQPGAQDFSEPVAQLIKVSSRGLLGLDRQQLIKRAGARFAHELDSIKFASDEIPVHLIAVGATESYGPNRNADGFKEASCRQYHDTFVKYARFYRDHCFPAGTSVVMANRERRNIESIQVGELVATLEGPQPVVRVMQQAYCGPGTKLKLSGVHTPLVGTTEHPVWVLRREQVHCRHKYSRLGQSKHGMLCREWRDGLGNLQPEYVSISTVRPGDYTLVPRVLAGSRLVEPAFARLLGWVGAEGNLGARGVIQFTFSSKNVADIDSVTRCLRANGLHVTETVRDDGLTQLASCSKALHAELSRYVTGKLSDKRFTGEILELTRESLYEVMATYIEGDGHTGKSHHKGQLRIRSSSPGMLTILRDIMFALDLQATVQWDCPPGVMTSPGSGKQYARSGSGVVNINAHFAPQVTDRTRKRCRRNSKRRHTCLQIHGCQLARVLRVESVEIDEPVYNLEVAGPHHYVANEVVVHNCNKNPAKSYGLVKLSAFHDPMKRIELIAALNADEHSARRNGGLVADREMEKLARGDDIPVSMACSVAYDVCSFCHNKAATREHYCDSPEFGGHCKAGGLKRNLGRLLEDGHILHADNPHPKFFDISHVWRPADRIAYVSGQLEKAAAHGPVSGAALAEAFGLTAPVELLIDSDLPRNVVAQLKLAHLLADLERDVMTKSAYYAMAFSPAVQSPISQPPGGRHKFAQVLRALADEQILLSPRDFVRLTTDLSEKQAEAASDAVTVVLPGIFGRLLSESTFAAELASNPYLPAPSASGDVRLWAKKHAADLSIAEPWLSRRAQLAAVRSVTPPDPSTQCQREKLAMTFDAGPTRTLARHYCLYKLGFLSTIPSTITDSGLTATATALQNYAI